MTNIKQIRNVIKTKVNKYKNPLMIMAGIFFIYALINAGTNPTIDIPTQSIFGVGSGSIAIGMIAITVAVLFGIFVPQLNILILPLLIGGGGWILGGFALNALRDYVTSIEGIIVIGVVIGLFILIFTFKKK